MKIVQSLHAQYRLLERGIDFECVKMVIRSPDKTEKQFGNRIKVEKTIDGRKYTVVYKVETSTILIITAI